MSRHGVLLAPVDDLCFEMFLDQDTFTALCAQKDKWATEDVWRYTGIDNTMFCDGAVPVKLPSPDHEIALHWFAQAHKRGYARGPPRYLLSGSMPADWALAHMRADQIRLKPEIDAVAFKCIMNQKNYPALRWTAFVVFADIDTQTARLQAALSLLG